MASNSFGNIFKITTWGESHGKAIGVVIDGCPAGLTLTEDDINQQLAMRAPGRNNYTTSRKESDCAQIYSGVFNNLTTGAPISIIIMNQDADSSKYEPIKNLLRPGHANFTYLTKYNNIYDYRGGGRASARETACRVAAAAVAKKILAHYAIDTCAYLASVGNIEIDVTNLDRENLKLATQQSPIFCPDINATEKIITQLLDIKQAGDSLGGVVEFYATGLPVGLGDPIYEKLEAKLAQAMLSLPASKGFAIGDGFAAAKMQGSWHNDLFVSSENNIRTQTNHAGGTLGGISTGMPLTGRVAFKPTSSIQKTQTTIDLDNLDVTQQPVNLTLPEGSRHDPCVAIRAVPVVDAMCALVLVDALLMNRCVVL
jgi:chorismate synthase